PQNDVTLKMPAFEWVHVQLHQQKGMISLSPPTICNSAANSNFSCSGFYMEIMATIILLGADQNFSDLFGNWLTFSACSSPCLDSF
ncbi:hypothetical protein, partial [Klebsiella quasipneumoniae]|uniref:hypothetical protein n=1 Tax=Klebsiella quasipneumoniae TaxID=1463165 RepID=UPI0031CE5F04